MRLQKSVNKITVNSRGLNPIDYETHAEDERYRPVNVQSDCTSVRDELVRTRKVELGSRCTRTKGNDDFGQISQKFMGALSIVFG